MFKMVVKQEARVMIGLIGLGPTKNKVAPRPFWRVFPLSLFFLRLFNSLTFLVITKVAQFNSLTGPLA